MFSKKHDNQLPQSEIIVSTIPEEFYGGKNPVVSFKNVTETVSLKKEKESVLTPLEKKAFQEATSAGSGKGSWHLANLATNPKALAVFAGIIFVMTILGVGGYYYVKNNFLAQKEVESVSILPPVITPTIEQPTAPTVGKPEITPIEPTTTPEIEIIKELPLEFPSLLLAESADLDNDGLTDLAEEEFRTDPGDFDTDKDKYPDGLEVYNLYNPKGFEPQRIVGSDLVKEYINSNFSYRLLLPVNWAIGSVDEEGRQVLFSTLSGENIELRVFDLQANEDFKSWFARLAPDQTFGDLRDFETYGKYPGKMRSDGLVYYFVYNDKVYVLLYHTTDSNIVNYKSVISMVARSLIFGEIVPKNPLLESLVTPLEQTAIVVTSSMTTTRNEADEEIF